MQRFSGLDKYSVVKEGVITTQKKNQRKEESGENGVQKKKAGRWKNKLSILLHTYICGIVDVLKAHLSFMVLTVYITTRVLWGKK